MIAIRKFAVAGATFAVLLAGAIVIQNSGAGASLVEKNSGGEPFAFSPLPELSPEEARDPRFGPILIAPEVASEAIGLALPDGFERTDRQEPLRLATIEFDLLPGAESASDCVPELLAVPVEGAKVDLALNAPCLPSASFVLHHQGMMGLTKRAMWIFRSRLWQKRRYLFCRLILAQARWPSRRSWISNFMVARRSCGRAR